jgi:hypothetical protein
VHDELPRFGHEGELSARQIEHQVETMACTMVENAAANDCVDHDGLPPLRLSSNTGVRLSFA